jgi:hypothetical protein
MRAGSAPGLPYAGTPPVEPAVFNTGILIELKDRCQLPARRSRYPGEYARFAGDQWRPALHRRLVLHNRCALARPRTTHAGECLFHPSCAIHAIDDLASNPFRMLRPLSVSQNASWLMPNCGGSGAVTCSLRVTATHMTGSSPHGPGCSGIPGSATRRAAPRRGGVRAATAAGAAASRFPAASRPRKPRNRASTGTTLTATNPTELAKLAQAHRPAATPAGTSMTAAITRMVLACQAMIACSWRRDNPRALSTPGFTPAQRFQVE